MATLAEQFRYADQRNHSKEAPKTKRENRSNDHDPLRGSIAKNAVFALERRAKDGTPSRKSTRASANRSRSDHGLLVREMNQGRSPEAVYARAHARNVGRA